MLVSAKERLDYVLRIFFLNYASAEKFSLKIDYGSKFESLIHIPDYSDNYFEHIVHFSEIKIAWINFHDSNLPLLFCPNQTSTPFLLKDGKIEFQFDLISAIFFFLSGWQELQFESTDKLGRFTYKESIQKKLNISALPVVDYYFKMLKEALELTHSIVLFNKNNSNGSFNVVVTHDIDYWQSLWRKEVKFALKSRSIKALIPLFFEFFNEQYFTSTLDKIADFQSRFGFKSTFFFLPSHQKYLGFENADYDLDSPKYSNFVQKLSSQNEIGLHGSFTASFESSRLAKDLNIIQSISPTLVNRFHFLMFDILKTPNLLEKHEISIDSTLGFNDKPGFRHSTSFPFYLFNFQTKIATNVVEIPLVIMDATLFHPQYLNHNSKEKAMVDVLSILDEIKKSGGNLVINWHNDAFAVLGREARVETFEAILIYCRQNKANFTNLREISNRLGVFKRLDQD